MKWSVSSARTGRSVALVVAVLSCFGCQAPQPRTLKPWSSETTHLRSQETSSASESLSNQHGVLLASHVPNTSSAQTSSAQGPPDSELSQPEAFEALALHPQESLADLEAWAVGDNPSLRRLQFAAGALWAKTGYIAALPDPTIGAMFYLPPMDFMPDRQVAEVQFMQMIPWLGRLSAQSRRAHLEAMAAENVYRAERLRVIGDVRAAWYKLYVINKQIETIQADRSQLESLVAIANARVSTGEAQTGDVLLATLELSNLQEQLLAFRQQLAATTAEIHRLVGRDALAPLDPPEQITISIPDRSHAELRDVAMASQPELIAAQLQVAATRWGIEIARLRRRPDVSLSAGWMVMDAPGAVMPGAGDDSLSLGMNASIPIGRSKYAAMVTEASREHCAAQAYVEEVAQRIDSTLRELGEEIRASQDTVELYETTILPQARQALEADRQSLVNGSVSFERVVQNYRTLLNLELGYHRALGKLATAVARLRQTVGVDIASPPDR